MSGSNSSLWVLLYEHPASIFFLWLVMAGALEGVFVGFFPPNKERRISSIKERFTPNARGLLQTFLAVYPAIWFTVGGLFQNYSNDAPHSSLFSKFGLVAILLGSIVAMIGVRRFVKRMITARKLTMAAARLFGIRSFYSLGTEDTDYGQGIIRLSSALMDELNLHRDQLVRIRRRRGATWIYRIARGTPSVGRDGPLMSDEIAADSIQHPLNLKGDQRHRANLILAPAPPESWVNFFWDHPDVLRRWEFRLGIGLASTTLLLGLAFGIPV